MFGKLICFAEECIIPWYWETYLDYSLFGQRRVIPIQFNLYFYKKLCEKPTPFGVGWIAQKI